MLLNGARAYGIFAQQQVHLAALRLQLVRKDKGDIVGGKERECKQGSLHGEFERVQES